MRDLDDVTFWAINTKSSEKLMKDNEDAITKGMTDTEKKAYLLGVENAFSIFNQLMSNGIDSESIMFYNPDVELGTEFTLGEMLKWLEKQ